jgi:uncharacterized protein DUF397
VTHESAQTVAVAGARWRTSSFSQGDSNCVELAWPSLQGGGAVRDSKNRDGAPLVVCHDPFVASSASPAARRHRRSNRVPQRATWLIRPSRETPARLPGRQAGRRGRSGDRIGRLPCRPAVVDGARLYGFWS